MRYFVVLTLCLLCAALDVVIPEMAEPKPQHLAVVAHRAAPREIQPIAIRNGVHYYSQRDAAILTARIWNVEVAP